MRIAGINTNMCMYIRVTLCYIYGIYFLTKFERLKLYRKHLPLTTFFNKINIFEVISTET